MLMKILIIRNYPSYMRVKNNTYNIQEIGLAKALVRKGHSCDIILWTNKEEENVIIPVDNIGIVHVFYKHGKTILKNTVFTGCDQLYGRYDILQPCEYNQMQAWILAKKWPNKTLIYHGPYNSSFNKKYNLMCKIFDIIFLKQYIKQGTKFLVKSELARDFLVGKGIDPENVSTVGVGIDAQMLSAEQKNCSEPLYQTMKDDPSALKLLYIGRFEKRRNIPFIIDVFKNVLDYNSNAHLYMIGTGNKRYMRRINSYMEKACVKNKVTWQEKMEQKFLSNVYILSDYFLLPTEYEIFGMVLLEAMYYKNVVLTTQNGGSGTLIQNGENGFVFKSKNAEQWARDIIGIQNNRTKREMIEINASQTIKENYTWDALADKFIKQYKSRLLVEE